MNTQFIPIILPTAKMVCQLLQAKEEFHRVEGFQEESIKIKRYKKRLLERIEVLEKELKKRGDYDN